MGGRPGMTDPSPDARAGALLAPDELPAVEIINGEGRGTAVLLCDHASRRVPSRLGGLGLDPAALSQHIAWDPGAAAVARRLSARLDAPLGVEWLLASRHRPQPTTAQPGRIFQPRNQRIAP
jgi:predicted N-formylglutamate amidohydrolase